MLAKQWLANATTTNIYFLASFPNTGSSESVSGLLSTIFGVKYVGKELADHLIKYIKENYDITEDWEGKRYLPLNFDWNYDTRSVHLSMP